MLMVAFPEETLPMMIRELGVNQSVYVMGMTGGFQLGKYLVKSTRVVRMGMISSCGVHSS